MTAAAGLFVMCGLFVLADAVREVAKAIRSLKS